MSTKVLDAINTGVVTGDDLQTLFHIAKENEFALPAVNVVSTSSINAVMEAAKNGLTKEQKETALANYWMQKRIAQIEVTDKEAKKRYEKIKKMQKKSNSKKELPDYATLEKTLKMQIANEKFIEELTKKAKIKLK